MQNLSPEGLRVAAEVAKRHGVSVDAVSRLLGALAEAMDARRNSTIPISAGWDNGRKAA